MKLLAATSVALIVGGLAAAGAAPEPETAEIRAAVAKAIPPLEKGTAGYVRQRVCFSCHHQAVPVLALALARKRGLKVDEANYREQLRFTEASLAGGKENYRKGQGQGGNAATASYALFTLEAGDVRPNDTSAAVAEYLILRDAQLDYWRNTADRPPSEKSHFSTTALVVRALRAYATPEQKERAAARIEKARAWILATEAKDTEDRVFRLLGLKYAGAAEAEVAAAARDLLAAQRPDGGWAQVDGMESDAYAAGSALVALHQAGGLSVTDPPYRRGVAFLIGSQKPDGTWYVASRSKPFQPYFESGFPYGKDQWISAAATGWAAAALALAIPE